MIFALFLLLASETPQLTDGEVWNEGVDYYESGDVTNALRVLKPLLLSKTHGARAAEIVAKLEYERGDLEAAANAAQIALRSNPEDERLNRNFTRAVDKLPEVRENARIERILKSAQGRDAGSILKESTYSAREVMREAGTYRTNSAERAIATSERLAAKTRRLADAWIPLRQVIAQSVTNEAQAATIITQLDNAQAKSEKALKELEDLDGEAYGTLSEVEAEFTKFLKLVAPPPVTMGEDLIAQSNAWLDVENFNNRAWQPEALDYTRSFRRQFPAWARNYEQQAQSDTNMAPFTAETQAKISALATELEKVQMECCEKNLPAEQQKAIEMINEIMSLLPESKGGGSGQGQPQANPQSQDQNQDKQQDQNQDQQQNQNQDQQDQQQEQQQDEQQQEEQAEEESKNDEEVEAVLKKAQERNDEHEADKKARMRKAPLPPNERDW